MHKIFSTIILTALLMLSATVTPSSAWQLTLDISTPDPNSDTGTATNRLVLGTDPTATDAYDNKFDTVALLKGPIQAYSAHPEYAVEQQRLWRDIRSDELPKEWTIEVNSLVEGNTINIKGGIDVPDSLNFTLIDLDKNKEIRIRASTEYSYNSTANTQKKLLLRVSEDTTINTNGNSKGSAAKGGGCGHIKDMNGNNSSTGGPGSVAMNMIILFAPLIWLTTRKTILSYPVILNLFQDLKRLQGY